MAKTGMKHTNRKGNLITKTRHENPKKGYFVVLLQKKLAILSEVLKI